MDEETESEHMEDTRPAETGVTVENEDVKVDVKMTPEEGGGEFGNGDE